MTTLNELGLLEEYPAEIVLTTFDSNGDPYASTMGVKVAGESKLLLRVFTDTTTFHNLRRFGAAVVNVTRDVKLLVHLALKDLFNFDVHTLGFEKSRRVNAPRLERADAFVEIEVENSHTKLVSDELGVSEIGLFETGVKYVEVRKPGVRALWRSESPALESAVLATKILVALKRGRKKTAVKIFHKLVRHGRTHGIVIHDPKERELLAELIKLLKRRFEW
jgi:hypothetical protein